MAADLKWAKLKGARGSKKRHGWVLVNDRFVGICPMSSRTTPGPSMYKEHGPKICSRCATALPLLRNHTMNLNDMAQTSFEKAYALLHNDQAHHGTTPSDAKAAAEAVALRVQGLMEFTKVSTSLDALKEQQLLQLAQVATRKQ